MNSRVTTILLLIPFLLLLVQPGLAPPLQSAARPSNPILKGLQNHLSVSNPEQEKRNEESSAQKVETMFIPLGSEFFTTIHWMQPLITNDLPDFSSLLVYTQTTSTFL
jgi:hypothetical protein